MLHYIGTREMNTTAADLGNEVIRYIVFPIRRIDAYLLAKADGCSESTCDMIAFGPQAERTGEAPVTLAFAKAWLSAN